MDYIMATSWLYGDNPPPPPPPENEYTLNIEEQQGEEVDEGKEKGVPLPAATVEKSTQTEEANISPFTKIITNIFRSHQKNRWSWTRTRCSICFSLHKQHTPRQKLMMMRRPLARNW
jgi:hypothetical protein